MNDPGCRVARTVAVAVVLLAALGCKKQSEVTDEPPDEEPPDEQDRADDEPPGPQPVVVEPPEEGLAIRYSADADPVLEHKAGELGRDLAEALRERDLPGRVVLAPDVPGGIDVMYAGAAEAATLGSSGILDDYDGALASRSCPSGTDAAVCLRIEASYAERLVESAFERTLATIREQAAKLIDGVYVAREGDYIDVLIPGSESDHATIARLDDRLRGGEARVQLVQEVAAGADLMDRLYRHARDDDRAVATGIEAVVETWDHGGQTYIDAYLRASDAVVDLPTDAAKRRGCWHPSMPGRPAPDGTVPCHMTGRILLEDYIGEVLDREDELVLGVEHELGYERRSPPGGGASFWRTYLLDAHVALTSADVASAIPVRNPSTNRPEVLVTFDRRGGETLRALTAANAGRKLAVSLDGTVVFAAVIAEEIAGGQLTLGLPDSNDPAVMEREAREIANALGAAHPLRLIQESSWMIGEHDP